MKDDLPVMTKVYLDAAELIRKEGWWQSTIRHPANRDKNHSLRGHCMMLAIWEAQDRAGMGYESSEFRKDFKRRFGDSPSEGMAWNDQPERTKEEVIAKLEEMAFK